MGGRRVWRKFLRISRFEWVMMAMTALFLVGTLVWYLTPSARSGLHIYTEWPASTLGWPDDDGVEAPGMLEGERLNLNTASAGDLTRLPGIGEGKAQAIVAWRERYGGFQAVDELLDVRGIGEATLETLRPYVTVGTAEGGD